MEDNIITGEKFEITGRGTVLICENCTYDVGDAFEFEGVFYLIRGIEMMRPEEKPYKRIGLLIRKLTKEERLKEAVYYVFKQMEETPKERKIKLMTYCKGNDGAREYGTNMDGLCNHTDCNQCRSFEKLFQEEAIRQLKELVNE